MKKIESLNLGQRLYTTLLLAIVALVSVTALTVAWFSIASRTNVYNFDLYVTAGPSLRIDLDAHSEFDQYSQTLSFDQIANRVSSVYGYDMRTVPIKPVTTRDAKTFTFQNGTVVETAEGAYWECPLHFMASDDMIVHLSAENSPGKEDGTLVSSSISDLPYSMRICFETDGQTMVYSPRNTNFLPNDVIFRKIYLQFNNNQVYNEGSLLFHLKGNQDKLVTLRVWMEGTDEACTDELKSADFSIRLRFEGTDEEGNRITLRRRY